MSTVTKIKGVITNYDLPVLTEQGLIPYWEGHFVNGLSNQGYTMTPSQEAAIRTFFVSLENTNILEYVRSFWPFLGNSANVNAAKVPLIGTKLFDFNSDFIDFQFNDNNEIVGLTTCPEVSSLNVMDFCDEHCVSLAASYIKKDTHERRQGISRVLNVGDTIQIRPFQVVETTKCFAIYSNQTTGKGTFPSNHFPDNFDDAGNAYFAMSLNDHAVSPYYNRYYKVNDGTEKVGAGTDENRIYAAPISADRIKTVYALSQNGFLEAETLTGLVVFNKVLVKDDLVKFMNALKALNIALGKEVTI